MHGVAQLRHAAAAACAANAARDGGRRGAATPAGTARSGPLPAALSNSHPPLSARLPRSRWAGVGGIMNAPAARGVSRASFSPKAAAEGNCAGAGGVLGRAGVNREKEATPKLYPPLQSQGRRHFRAGRALSRLAPFS